MRKLLFAALPLALTIISATTSALNCPDLSEAKIEKFREPSPQAAEYHITYGEKLIQSGNCHYNLSSSADLLSAGIEGSLEIKLKPYGLSNRCPALNGYTLEFEAPTPNKMPYEILGTADKCEFSLESNVALDVTWRAGFLRLIPPRK